MDNDLIERLMGASARLCGGYYEPKNDQEAADGALMLEAATRLTKIAQRMQRTFDPHPVMSHCDCFVCAAYFGNDA